MDASEFKRRFLPLQRSMYWTAWRLSGNTQEAEDMVQEAFLKLWTRRSELPRMESAEAYCITLVRRLYYDKYRARHLKTISITAEELPFAAQEDIVRRIDTSRLSDKVKERIRQLPESQRLVITLRDVEDRPFDEIARLTNLSESNIRVILSRARKTIRAQFGKS